MKELSKLVLHFTTAYYSFHIMYLHINIGIWNYVAKNFQKETMRNFGLKNQSWKIVMF